MEMTQIARDWTAALIVAVPVTMFLGFVAVQLTSQVTARWRRARLATSAALILALAGAMGCAAGTAGPGESWLSSGMFGVRPDAVGATMLLLVAFVAWVITRFSERYLAGEAGAARYVPALLATITSVMVVVVGNHLVVLAGAWIATSLSLHQLLTFYDDRPAALIVAHKKFLASRAADVALIAAVALIGWTWGTFDIDVIARAVKGSTELPTAIEIAAVLLALTAVLKCAQLPVHGWLIQVMEAPTPVSALLHAGVVNLGGFVLIRLAELVGAAPAAQILLVTVGTSTAVLAALVMSTRISVKVMLAWSTCAQMGFMLMQVGLGLYELALLHIVAHSLYKAHAFLGAGTAVAQARISQLSPVAAPPTVALRLLAAAAGGAAIWLASVIWPAELAGAPGLVALALVASLALVPLLRVGARASKREWLLAPLAAAAVAVAYIALHALARATFDIDVLPNPAVGPAVFVAVAFAGLFLLQTVLAARPQGSLAERLHPWFYCGFYLDELFTRLTFRVWPARLRSATSGTGPMPVPSSTGEAR